VHARPRASARGGKDRVVPPTLPAAELARYADALVRCGAGLRRGDTLVVNAEPGHREGAVALVEAAYRAGAAYAEVQLVDPFVRAAQLRSAPERSLGLVTPWREKYFRERERPEVAAINLYSETEPEALKDVDPERAGRTEAAADRQLPWLNAGSARRRYAIVPWATDAWARRVYPSVKLETARRRLARDLLVFCRVGPDDPPGWQGLKAHLDAIDRRGRRLTKLGLRRLEVRGPAVELTLGIPDTAVWLGSRDRNAHGRVFASNVPTEENCTSPDAGSVEGTFRCTRPVMVQGRLLEDIRGELRGGRVVRLDAKGRGGDFLRRYLGSAGNADRLGEIALVDGSSRIGRAGRLYYNALLDENAVAHMAFGDGISQARSAGRKGLNRSDLHLDVMIGGDDLEATGVDARGRRVPLIRDGLWQI
jgi:aminopeptidase